MDHASQCLFLLCVCVFCFASFMFPSLSLSHFRQSGHIWGHMSHLFSIGQAMGWQYCSQVSLCSALKCPFQDESYSEAFPAKNKPLYEAEKWCGGEQMWKSRLTLHHTSTSAKCDPLNCLDKCCFFSTVWGAVLLVVLERGRGGQQFSLPLLCFTH